MFKQVNSLKKIRIFTKRPLYMKSQFYNEKKIQTFLKKNKIKFEDLIYDQFYQKYKKIYKYLNPYIDLISFFSLSILLGFLIYCYEEKKESQKMSDKEFTDMLNNKQIQNIVFYKYLLNEDVYRYIGRIYTKEGEIRDINVSALDEFINILRTNQIDHSFSKSHNNNFLSYYRFTKYVSQINIYLVIFVSYYTFKTFAKRSIGSITQIKQIQLSQLKVRFSDFAGMEEVKKEITEYVDFLKNSEKYSKMGAKIPRGALLAGPPGTGKTFLAKACASEANVPFFYLSGSEFVTGYVGMGAKAVSNLFTTARKNSPSIIFIDELDAIGNKRDQKFGNPEGDNTLNQLLVEMDGFNSTEKVIVFAATNLAGNLDDALTRSGRFDRKIEITLPDKEARKQILGVHLKKLKLMKGDLERFEDIYSNITPGFSGAQLENLCNEAAIFASREHASYVKEEHFDQAIDRVVQGIQTNQIFPIEHRQRIAIYECTKAVASWFLETQGPIIKISLIPRSQKDKELSQYLKKDQALQKRSELIEKIAFHLSGRIGEQVILGEISTRVKQDLEKAYEIAQKMVTKLGMSNLGLMSLKDDHYQQYSDFTNERIDQEIKMILNESKKIIEEIIESKKELIKKMAEILLEQEKLSHLQIVDVLGARPFQDNIYKDYFEEELRKKKQIHQIN